MWLDGPGCNNLCTIGILLGKKGLSVSYLISKVFDMIM